MATEVNYYELLEVERSADDKTLNILDLPQKHNEKTYFVALR